MPPKSGKGSAKSPKSNKREKERQKKEEAEQKAAAEEELRLQQEREEQERLAHIEFEIQERQRLEEEEQERRKGQLEDLQELWESGVYQLTQQEGDERRTARWQRFMLCDGSPDPTVGGEINTYMNLWRDNDSRTDINAVLQDSVLALSLIGELGEVIETTPPDELIQEDVVQYRKTMQELQELLKDKFDIASQKLLLNASTYADSETMNLQKVMGDGATTLCMWGNLSKNPRIKSHEFSEVNFMFEMPKLLTLSDCSIRVMFCKYDHYSSRCKSFLPRVKPRAVPVIEPPTEVIVEDVDGEKEKVEGEEEVPDGTASRTSKIDDAGSVHKEEDPPAEDITTALQGMESAEEIEGEQEEAKEEEEVEKESVDENPSPEPDQFEDFDGDIDALDMRANHVLGGIFHFNLFHLPPQPKFVKNWLITQVIEPCELSYMDYKVEPVLLHTPSNAESKSLADGEEGENHEEGEGEGEEKDKEKEKVESPPTKETTRQMSAKENDKGQEKKDLEKTAIGVVMKLPDTVYFCEDPQVCRWNEELQQWQVDGFNDRIYNEENRTLSFKTNYFGTMALVQDAHINMPFQSWELRPRATNCTILTVIAAIIEVEIEIKDNLCCLRQPNKPELAHLIEHYMRPKQFIKKMAAAGLNIFPAVDSAKYVSIQEKSVIVEVDVYRQMAITASMMAYSWSKWNSGVQNKKPIIIQGAEHLKDEHLLEEDWGLFMITKKRSIKLKMTEFDETFGDEHAPGTQFHASLYHLTKAMASDKGKERLEDTKFPFVDTVYTLLKAVRPLTYA